MSQLEPPEDTETAPGDERPTGDDRQQASPPASATDHGHATASISVPADATEAEAAAVAAAVGAHLRDHRRAAAQSAAERDVTERTDQWVLASRLPSRGKREWRNVERGDEWRAAARSF